MVQTINTISYHGNHYICVCIYVIPAFLGKDLQDPSPFSWMYSVKILSSSAVHLPFFNPTFSQQGVLPIDMLLFLTIFGTHTHYYTTVLCILVTAHSGTDGAVWWPWYYSPIERPCMGLHPHCSNIYTRGVGATTWTFQL